ncbi:DNA recombination protein RmuC [Colwelliaceae bacterium BS250]
MQNIPYFPLIALSTLALLSVLMLFLMAKVSAISKLLTAQNNESIVQQDRQQQLQQQLQNMLSAQEQLRSDLQKSASELRMQLMQQLNEHKEQFNKNQMFAINQLIAHLNKSTKDSREELSRSLQDNSEVLAKRMTELTQSTDKRLQDISKGVEQRLTDGFDKTTKTFNDIVKRLALIDDAQKKITELSTNVVSLQEVLADKRSRGAFGEVQLNALIRNVLPEKHFAIQHTLSNGKIADCILFLPNPTGNVVIDSKFPLESYKKMTNIDIGDADKKVAERQFKVDIKKHISDISDKYLIDNETADGAVMFIPAEAIFAEIHAHYPELVEEAYKKRVWLSSPTTLMAILTTARSVLKDEDTRQQIHIIQQHLSHLAGDFGRFRTRFNNLAKHIDQAANDVQQIHTSADKIAGRFEKIEQVDLAEEELKKIDS